MTPAERADRIADVFRLIADAIAAAPGPVADILAGHHDDEGNEWAPIGTSSLLCDVAYYSGEETPALVLYLPDGDAPGFMYVEGSPEDAAYQASFHYREGRGPVYVCPLREPVRAASWQGVTA
jgi:hypothetical protein